MKTPIVLVPGTCFTTRPLRQYFYGVEKDLADQGIDVLFVGMPAFRTIEDRATVLRKAIRERFGTQPIHLIAHSSGGLDCRYFISVLGGSSQARSLTTIATPHRGSSLIQFWQDVLPLSVLKALKRYCERDGGTFDTYLQLSPDYINRLFNPTCLDSSGTTYRSVIGELSSGARFQGFPIFWVTSRIISKFERGNDGFVSTESAKWGEVIARINADHYQLVGHPFGLTRGISHLKLYRELVQGIA